MAGNKKKRKKNTGESKKVTDARHFKDLWKRMRYIAKAAGAEEAFLKIPQKEMRYFRFLQIRAFTVSAVNEISPKIIKAYKALTVNYLKKIMFSVGNDDMKISLYEYFMAGEQLMYYVYNLPPESYDEAAAVRKAFEPFIKITRKQNAHHFRTMDLAHLLCMTGSDITKEIHEFEYDRSTEEGIPLIFRNRFLVKRIPAEILKFTDKNSTHTAYRLIWVYDDLEVIYWTVSLGKLGLKTHFGEIEVDVYVQQHALMRLRERLDCLYWQLLMQELCQSIKNCKVEKNKKGQSFLAFHVYGKKVGYLVFSYVEGVVVIRTFLLLTNNDTPEGEKLHRQFGLEKLDKQFLGIDKLSAFAAKREETDERILKLFERAGCGNLFDSPNHTDVKSDSMVNDPEKLLKYLGIANLEKNEAEKK